MPLGERIKLLRRKNKLTQSQLGSYLGLAESTISLYESGKRSPDYDTLIQLANYFNVSVDYLLGQTNDQTPGEQIGESTLEYNSPLLTNIFELPVLNTLHMNTQGIIYEKSSNKELTLLDGDNEELYFWLKVKDKYMSGDGILPGDLALIKSVTITRNNDMIAALFGSEPARIYRYYQNDNQIFLHSSNSARPPRMITEADIPHFKIVGKVLEIRRKL